MDHWEGICISKAMRMILSNHLNEEFEKQVSMEVTKRINDIMGDIELKKKLIFVNVDDEFNKRVSKVAIERYKGIEVWS
jgi:hypothetical protein